MSNITSQYVVWWGVVFLIVWCLYMSYMGYRMGYQRGRHKARMSMLDVLHCSEKSSESEREEKIKILNSLWELWNKEDR
jgi:hypothetical protein